MMRKNKGGGSLLHCSTNPVRVEEEFNWSVVVVSQALFPFPLKTGCIRLFPPL
jgi:hypothetical protein